MYKLILFLFLFLVLIYYLINLNNGEHFNERVLNVEYKPYTNGNTLQLLSNSNLNIFNTIVTKGIPGAGIQKKEISIGFKPEEIKEMGLNDLLDGDKVKLISFIPFLTKLIRTQGNDITKLKEKINKIEIDFRKMQVDKKEKL